MLCYLARCGSKEQKRGQWAMAMPSCRHFCTHGSRSSLETPVQCFVSVTERGPELASQQWCVMRAPFREEYVDRGGMKEDAYMRLLKIKGGYGESRQKEQNRAFPCCQQIKVGIVWWDTGSETTGAIRRLGSSWSCVIMSAISCEKKKKWNIIKRSSLWTTYSYDSSSISLCISSHASEGNPKWEAALNEQQTAVWHCLPWSYIWKWRSLDCMSAGWSECPLLSSGLKIAQTTGLKGQFPVVIASGFPIVSRPSHRRLLLFCLAKPLETLGLCYLPSSWWRCPVFPSCSNPKVTNRCLFLSSPKQPLQTYPPHRIVYWWFLLASIMRFALLANRHIRWDSFHNSLYFLLLYGDHVGYARWPSQEMYCRYQRKGHSEHLHLLTKRKLQTFVSLIYYIYWLFFASSSHRS